MSIDSQSDQDELIFLDEPEEVKKPFWVRRSTLLLLILIFAGAIFFRFIGRDFDQNTNQHPDERAIINSTLQVRWPTSFSQLLDPKTSPLNLRNDVACGNAPNGCEYPWGSLPVYLARGASWVLDTVLPPTADRQKGYYLNDYNGQQMVGRTLASIFDLITVLLVFLIARRLYSSAVALIATALVAFAVTEIQIAHYYISEPFLVCFMVGAIYFSVALMQKPAWWAAAGAGACLGFAVASKVTIAFFGLIIIAAIVLRAVYRTHSRKLGADLDDPVGIRAADATERNFSLGRHLLRGLRYFLIAAVFTVLAFSISEPYALWQFDLTPLQQSAPGVSLGDNIQAVLQTNPWTRRIEGEAGIQSGEVDIPYTRQYVGTVPVLYHFEQLVLWGMGVLPGLIGVAGILLAMWLAIRGKPAEILLLAGAIPYFLTIAGLEAKWMRYMLPLVPIVAILGAALLVRGINWAHARFPRTDFEPRLGLRYLQRNFFTIAAVLTVSFAVLWTIAFANIYTQDESRVQASAWIYNNVPDGASLSVEGWDDGLPVGLSSIPGQEPRDFGSRQYKQVQFNLYDDRAPDDELSYLSGLFKQTDYIILASNRLYGSISRLPWRYPVQIAYYQMLYQGKLGYVLVHTEQVTPQLLGISINDQLADESFTVYDHPRVDVFKKVSDLTDDQLHTVFSTALNRPIGEYSQARHGKVTDDNSLMLKGSLADQPDVSNYAWNPLAQQDTQWFAVFFWLLATYLLSFAAMPIVFTIFKRLPDKGYPLAKLVGLLLVSWGTWILASARLLTFNILTVLLMSALLVGLGLLTWKLGAGAEIRDFLRRKRNLIFFYEGLFLVGFAVFLFIRMLNPDLWQTTFGGEKPMDVGFLNAILRSPYMPPADPFFADGSINYYYQGQFILATLIKLVGVDSALAFNLSIALLYGLVLTAGACIVYNLVAWSQRRRGSTRDVSRAGIWVAVLSCVLMVVIGNLHGLMQLVMIDFPTTTQTIIRWGQDLGFVGPSWSSAYTQFNFWDPSRIINGTINEFPFWSFLYADLHPHLIDMPFTLLAAAFGMNLAFAGRFNPSRVGLRSPSWFGRIWARVRAALGWLWGTGGTGLLTFGVMAVALGTLFAVNSWDWPTFFGIAGGATLIALLLSRQVPKTGPDGYDLTADQEAQVEDHKLGAAGAWSLVFASLGSVLAVGLVSLGAYLPFFLNFKAFYTKILPLVDGGLIDNTNTIMHRTTLAEYLVVWAIFVFIAVSYLLFRLWNFPWAAALADLANLIPGGRESQTSPAMAPAQAFADTPVVSDRRLKRLALSPSYAGGGTIASVAFASQGTDEEFALRPSVTDPVPAAVAGDDQGSTADDAHRMLDNESVDGIVGALNGESAETAAEENPPDSSQEISPWGNGVEEGDLTSAAVDRTHVIEPSNWVAEAHSEVRRQVAVPRQVEQPGIIPLWGGLGLLALTAGLVILQLVTHQYLLALLVALIGGISATLLSTSRSVSALFGGLLLVTALLVSLGVEVVYLGDHLAGSDMFRMNTVFKFYIQVWLLFALGGGVAIYFMIFGSRERSFRRKETDSDSVYVRETSGAYRDEFDTRPLGAIDSTNPTFSNGADDGQHESAQPLQPDSHPSGNWLVWSADEIEDYGVAPTSNASEDEVASVVGLLPYSEQPYSGTQQPGAVSGQENSEWGQVSEPTQGADYDEPEPVTDAADLLKVRWNGWRTAWTTVFALFILGSLVFTWYGTQDKIRYRFPDPPPFGTLSGTQYMETAQFGTSVSSPNGEVPLNVNLKYDYQAINWMNKNIPGLATIAELPAEYYRADGMRAASNTGLPMVIGGLHQDEQRAGSYVRLVQDRQQDMNEFFTTPDVQRALIIISKYDIQYIYLGQLEQARAGDAGMKKFQQMSDPKIGILIPVFSSDPKDQPGTIVYKVATAADKNPKTVVGVPVANSGLPGISITPLPTNTPIPPPTPPVDNPVLKQLIAAVTADPGNKDKRAALIDWYRQNGYHLEAAQQLFILAKADPTNVAVWSQLGDEYAAANMPDDALKAWETIRDNVPNNPDAHNKVGIAYVDRKRYDDAQKEFQAAVDADKQFVESWFHLGEVYERKGDIENAKKAYQGAIDNSPADNGWKDSAQQRLNALK